MLNEQDERVLACSSLLGISRFELELDRVVFELSSERLYVLKIKSTGS